MLQDLSAHLRRESSGTPGAHPRRDGSQEFGGSGNSNYAAELAETVAAAVAAAVATAVAVEMGKLREEVLKPQSPGGSGYSRQVESTAKCNINANVLLERSIENAEMMENCP